MSERAIIDTATPVTVNFYKAELPSGEKVDIVLQMRNPLEIKLGAKTTFEIIDIVHYVRESRRS